MMPEQWQIVQDPLHSLMDCVDLYLFECNTKKNLSICVWTKHHMSHFSSSLKRTEMEFAFFF